MQTSREEIARERRRQIQVRKAFQAGLDTTGWAGADAARFYLCCADYLRWSMDRLHEQDQRIHDLLRERIPAAESEAHERLAVLGERQERSRALMRDFSAAAERLRAAGVGGIRAFEQAAREFTATFNSLLQARKNPFFQHTDRLFRDADWSDIAGVSEQSLADEARLFGAVQASAPHGIDPAAFTAEHKPG